MQFHEDIQCIFCVLQILTGVFGNSLALYLYGSSLITSQNIRPLDVIFINLSFSHIVMIIFRGIPFAIHICIHTIFMGDIECKIIIFLQRVARSLSLCTTCLLSVYQAITISSGNPVWSEIKSRAPKYIIQSCVFIWVLNLLIDITVPLYVAGPRNCTNNMLSRVIGYCSIDRHAMTTSKLVIWKSLYDAMFVGFMAMTSSYMVVVLYRHHRQVQHIHNNSLNPSSSPETRATKIILLLMSIFICFYSVSSIMTIVMDNPKFTDQVVTYFSVLFNLCYPTISPFILISSDSQIFTYCNVFKRMTKSYSHSS
ncbi:vomeronasal type-1 receptor 4-like [Notamacropus eugenii]|uniref:vomeronasal type-1 receptor 4-like n=1 Tax=Notamacropus eugenii TaxID=9315 RepID=UPI003B66C6B4